MVFKPFTTLFMDLDDTLYPASSGLWLAIRQRIELFVAKKLNLPLEEALVVRHNLFIQYGTTLRGLQAAYQVDENEYLSFVHDLPLSDYFGPDLSLRETLLAYPEHKVIFTNADMSHARRVLAARELEGCFDKIIDIHAIQPFCKPMPEAFKIAFDLLGVDPRQCVLIDDMLPNLVTAKSFGMRTVWITDKARELAADFTIPVVNELPKVLPPGSNGHTAGG